MKSFLKCRALFVRLWGAVCALGLCVALLGAMPVGAVASGYVYPAAAGSPFVTERRPDASRVPGGTADFAAKAVSMQFSSLSGTGLPKAQHMQISISKSIVGTTLLTPAEQAPEFSEQPSLTPESGTGGTIFSLTYGAVIPQTALLSAVLTVAGTDVTNDIVLSPEGMTYTAPMDGPKGEMIWQVSATTAAGSVVSEPRVSAVSSGTTDVTMGAVTFTLAGEYQSGMDVGGKPYVVVPSGTATVIAVSPAQAFYEGDVINGLMKNPVRITSSNPDQGYDGRWSTYDPALTADLPVSVTAGDVLIKTVARTPHVNRRGAFDQIAALHVVSVAPPSGAYLASSVQWEGQSTPDWYATDIDTFYAGLTKHSSSGIPFPSYAVLMQSFDQFYPLYAQISAASGMGYENASPFGFGGGSGNYGRYMSSTVETAMLALVTDVYTEPQAKTILRRLVQHGIEWGDPMLYGPASANNGPDGGHHQFHQGPVAVALAVTGRSADLPLLMQVAPGNWVQAFKIDAAWRQIMADPVGTAVTRNRTLGVQPGGTVVRFAYENSSNGPDWYQIKIPAGAALVRASDGVSVGVTAETPIGAANPKNGTFDVPIDSVSPFVQGDTVAISMPDSWIAEGLYDWALRGSQRPHLYSPVATNQYRSLQRWGTIMAMRSMGLTTSNMEAVEGYLSRSGATADPAPYNDYPAVVGRYVASDDVIYDVSPQFYNRLWSGISASP